METKTFNVGLIVKCFTNGSIQVPKNFTFEQAIEYAKSHIREIPLGQLEYIDDSDVIDEDNCDFEE